jgi:hypothetical protein
MAKFSLKSLHTKLDETLERLRAEPKSAKRDEMIKLVQGLRTDSKCPQVMVIDL